MITVVIISIVWAKVCKLVSTNYVNDNFNNQLFYQLPKPKTGKTHLDCTRFSFISKPIKRERCKQ